MVSQAVKLEREKRKTAREERQAKYADRVLDVLTSPNVLRLAMIAGIIAYSTQVARSGKNEGPVKSALAFALPGIGIPLIAADAGIRDKWALAAISGSAIGYTTGQMLEGWQLSGVIPDVGDIWAALTPWKD